MKKIFLSLFLFCIYTFNCFGENHIDSISNPCKKYKQEIKELYEDHYGKEFKISPEMKSACIDYIERKIDGKEDAIYKECNFFVSRRFKKEAFQSNDGISKEDILYADFRHEFVEDNLNDPRFNSVNADKIHVEIGDYKDYVYVVVGVTSSWYEKNPDLWFFENDNNK